MSGASMDASLRMLSLWSTRAVCPALRRLGRACIAGCALYRGVALGDVGVSVAGEAAVGVGASVVGCSVAAEVDVGEGAAVVGVLVGSTVCGTCDGTMVSVASDARIASVETGDGDRVSVWSRDDCICRASTQEHQDEDERENDSHNRFKQIITGGTGAFHGLTYFLRARSRACCSRASSSDRRSMALPKILRRSATSQVPKLFKSINARIVQFAFDHRSNAFDDF